MASGVTLDFNGLRAGLAAKTRAVGKAAPEIPNRAARNVCLKAASLTPKADPAKIEAELRTNGLLFKILQSPGFRARLPRKVQGMMAGGGRLTRVQINAAAKVLLQLRRQSARAIRAGWIKAGQAFGNSSKQRVSAKGLPGQSYGKRATTGTPVAEAANLARGADKVGAAALQEAADFVGNDMRDWAERHLAKAFNAGT